MASKKLSAMTEITAPAGTDLYYTVPSATGDKKIQLKHILGLIPVPPGGRLTLTSGTPVTTADVSAATSIYYTPYVSNCIQLWDGNQWELVNFTEKTLAVGTLTSGRPYDVFGYLSGNDLVLESLSWTSDTARATGVSYQDGRLCKTGDKTRLLLGTFYTTSTTTTEDSAGNRFLSNFYNRVQRPLTQATVEGTDNWTYSTNTWRQARASGTNQLNYVATYADIASEASVYCIANGTVAGNPFAVGVGVNSTTTPSSVTRGTNDTLGSGGTVAEGTATWMGYGQTGKNALVWLEISNNNGTNTFYGDAGAIYYQSGIYGRVWQ